MGQPARQKESEDECRKVLSPRLQERIAYRAPHEFALWSAGSTAPSFTSSMPLFSHKMLYIIEISVRVVTILKFGTRGLLCRWGRR